MLRGVWRTPSPTAISLTAPLSTATPWANYPRTRPLSCSTSNGPSRSRDAPRNRVALQRMDSDTERPAVGRTVWVIDDDGARVAGIVSNTGEGIFGAAESVVVELAPGRVCIVLLSKRGTQWDFMSC